MHRLEKKMGMDLTCFNLKKKKNPAYLLILFPSKVTKRKEETELPFNGSLPKVFPGVLPGTFMCV